MIRLVQRKLIIPQGDTGSFSIPPLVTPTPGTPMVAVFSIFNERERIFQKEYEVGEMVTIGFTHEDTKDLPVGTYNWDVKIYTKPQYDESGILIDGEEVDSYYAGFKLPECQIALAPTYGRG